MLLLSKAEVSVLLGIVHGYSTPTIASKINKSDASIAHARTMLKSKIKNKTTMGLHLFALSYGFYNDRLNIVPEYRRRLKINEQLTPKESMFLHIYLSDFSMPEIAQQMDLDNKSVVAIKNQVQKKWKVSTLSELVMCAIHKGYLSISTIIESKGSRNSKEFKLKVWEAYRTTSSSSRLSVYLKIYECECSYPRFHPNNLSKQQEPILQSRFKGASNEELAKKFGVSEQAISNSLTKIRNKMEAKNTADLIRASIDCGLLRLFPEPKIESLEPLQVELLKALSRSQAKSEIAAHLQITSARVSEILSSLKSEWRVNSTEGLIVRALCKGILTLEEL